MSNGQKKNLVERLETMEMQMSRVNAVESMVMNLRKSVTTVIEMVNALVDELGGNELGDKISARLDEKRAQQRRVEADRSAAILKQLIDSGQVEKADLIAEDSIITGIENMPDGRIKDERLQINLGSFNEDVRAELLGKGVGYAVERDGVKVFIVDGIYKMKPLTAPAQVSEPVVDSTQVVGDSTSAPEVPGATATPTTESTPTPTDAPVAEPASVTTETPAVDPTPTPATAETPVAAPEATPAPTEAPVAPEVVATPPTDATAVVADPTPAAE